MKQNSTIVLHFETEGIPLMFDGYEIADDVHFLVVNLAIFFTSLLGGLAGNLSVGSPRMAQFLLLIIWGLCGSLLFMVFSTGNVYLIFTAIVGYASARILVPVKKEKPSFI